MRPQPRVQSRKHTSSHHGHTGVTRHSPRNGFNGFLRALPGDRACLPPSPSGIASANLTPASGRQDHTTSPSANRRPRLWRRLRPPHPAPYVRDDRETPLCLGRDGSDIDLIWVRRKQESFCWRGWTGKSVICPSGKSRPHLWSYKGARTHSPSAKIRYAAHFGLNANMGVGPLCATSGLMHRSKNTDHFVC
jgi:hypothetical protein